MENGIECMQVSGPAYLFLLLKRLSSSSVKTECLLITKEPKAKDWF